MVAVVCGFLAFVMAAFSVYEAIARRVFNSPTSWTLDTSCYILIWVFFVGSSFAFQEHAHVGVDMIRDLIDKHTKTKTVRRILAVIGYVITEVFLGVLLKGSFEACISDKRFGFETATSRPFPMFYLHLAMVVGLAMMMVTVFFMILDCLKNDEYL